MSSRRRRGCLKSPIASPSLDAGQSRKCVAFCDAGSEEVHVADEWDRTPSEPARSLSYQDILELKAIQRTLPRANQLPDMYTGKPASQFLSKVPIGLLPLLPTSSPPPPPPTTTDPSPPRQPSEERTSYFPPSSPPPKVKKFAFLPLLETPPASPCSCPPPPPPPPSTINSGHAPFFHVPPSKCAGRKAGTLQAVASPGLLPPSPLFLDPPPQASSSKSAAANNNLLGSATPIRRRNVMYINGQEIDLDEEEEAQKSTVEETIRPELVSCSFRSRRSRSISAGSLKQEKLPPSPPIPIAAPIPTPHKVASSPSSSAPISTLSPVKIRSSSPVQSRSSVRSPPATTNSFAPIKVVRATRDNRNPSNLVSLSSSWRRSPSPRTSPVPVPLA
ncbi:uncharacterized protein BT62DRAFT_326383 [Guyanagaster necrorhizus]|uniref:Uncharacterized protein n=1 Tax=Guyanagaster necrorhizus TaxID=856835 RepID=A0A9P7VNY9_9AGAR|nr:uncharacterized protein BT62DRAFT_326383 [Guyanagaster necrorhizus MCA 3950]KAG7443339.1 hypothetical protein BT62DRAFT_326383 [Guyanagaster necrorhizus MCA 3950]